MPLANKPATTAVATPPPAATAVTPPLEITKAAEPKSLGKKPVAKDTGTMSKAEWAQKDVRISRQGLFQAALQSTGLLQLNSGNTFADYMALVEQAAERGLEFVNRGA